MGLVVIVSFVPFNGIERIFGYLGCALLVYVVAAVHLRPDWHHVAQGVVPNWHASGLYAYFVVGVIGAALVPYEVYFYSSGAIEDGWGIKDLNLNRANAVLGFTLGGILSIALDDQLVDVDGRRCGRADDIEFDGGLGERPVLHAILSGSGTWHRRLPRPLRSLGARVFGKGLLGRDVLQVSWDEVDDIGSVIRLRVRARELGLGQGDCRRAETVARLPDS